MAGAVPAKEWRGIIPLQSSRSDVERLLGTPTRKVDGEAYIYNFVNEVAIILFQSSTCDTELGRFGFGWNVPSGTVTNIVVIPLKTLRVDDFIDVKEFGKDEGGLNYVYYTNVGQGLTVETLDGIVVRIMYESTSKDESKRCPRLQDCCLDFGIFDQYGNISFTDEKARLDNFAIQMKEFPTLLGIIVAYGGRRGRIAEAKNRAARARSYLIKERGIEPWRVVAGDGGYREDLTVELSLRPIADSSISRIYSSPTLLPSDVEIIRDAKVKKTGRRKRRKP